MFEYRFMKAFVFILLLGFSCGISAQEFSSVRERSYYVKNQESAGQVHEVIPKARRGYYVKDSVLVDNVFIEDDSRADRLSRVIIPKQQNHGDTVFYPRDIDAYGFPDEERYVSCTIQQDGAFHKVFLEEFIRLNDTTTLFRYQPGKTADFYLQTGQDLRLLTKENFLMLGEMILDRNEGCLPETIAYELSSSIDPRTIRLLYEAFTRCNANVIQRVKYGPTWSGGAGWSDGGNSSPASANYTGTGFAWTAGAFVQLPLDLYFNFRAEVLFSSLYQEKSRVEAGTRSNLTYLRRSLQVPLLFRYNANLIRGRFIPYVEAGPLLDFRLGGRQVVTDFSATDPSVCTQTSADIAFLHYGAAAGIGVEYKINTRQSLYAGLRYHFMRGENLQKDREEERVQHLLFNVSWGF